MKILRIIMLRLFQLGPTLLGLITIVFFLTYYLPADPVSVASGPFATEDQREAINKLYGFDKPVYIQYVNYIKRIILKGDFGRSLYTQREIGKDILKRLPATLELAVPTLCVGALLGIALGVYSGLHRNSLLDHVTRGISIAAISLASFWVALELQLIFSYELPIAPLLGRIRRDIQAPNHITGFYILDSILTLNGRALLSSLAHLVLPATASGLVIIGTIARFTRTGVLGIVESGYIEYGKGMGLSQRLLVWKYLLKNALTGTVAQIGLLFGYVLASTFVVEYIFMWPGIGKYALDSILYLDYKAVFAVTLWTGLVYATGSLLADIGLVLIDPREVEK